MRIVCPFLPWIERLDIRRGELDATFLMAIGQLPWGDLCTGGKACIRSASAFERGRRSGGPRSGEASVFVIIRRLVAGPDSSSPGRLAPSVMDSSGAVAPRPLVAARKKVGNIASRH